MNLAILIVGRIKGYTHVEQTLMHLQKQYNATFFCSLNKKHRSAYIDTFCKKFNIGDDQLNLELLKTPEHILHYPAFYTNPHNLYSFFYHLNKSFEVLEKYQDKHRVKYNCVLLYRADIESSEDLQIVPPEKDTVYIPIAKDAWGINGEIAYGDFHTMKKYCNLVNLLETLIKDPHIVCSDNLTKNEDIDLKNHLDMRIGIFHPEINLKRNLEINNIHVKRFPYKYKMHPSRHFPLPEYNNTE